MGNESAAGAALYATCVRYSAHSVEHALNLMPNVMLGRAWHEVLVGARDCKPVAWRVVARSSYSSAIIADAATASPTSPCACLRESCTAIPTGSSTSGETVNWSRSGLVHSPARAQLCTLLRISTSSHYSAQDCTRGDSTGACANGCWQARSSAGPEDCSRIHVWLQEVLSVCAVSLVHGSYGPQYPHSAAGDVDTSKCDQLMPCVVVTVL